MLVRVRLHTDLRPVGAIGLRITYRHGFRNHTQNLPGPYRII
jgi:hypothetical protein